MMPAPAFGVLLIGLAGACTWIEFGMYIPTNYLRINTNSFRVTGDRAGRYQSEGEREEKKVSNGKRRNKTETVLGPPSSRGYLSDT